VTLPIRSPILVAVAALAAAALTLASPPASRGASPAQWPQFQGDAAHTGFNDLETTLDPQNVGKARLAWFDAVPGSLFNSSPIVANSSVYIGGEHGDLSVFPEQGCGAARCQPTWVGATASQTFSAPAVADGFAYLTTEPSIFSNDGRLDAFDANGCGHHIHTCQPLWEGIGGDLPFVDSSPAVSGGVVYVGGTDGKLYAFAARGCGQPSCQPLWTAQVGDSVDGAPAVANGVVYTHAFDGTLAALDAAGCGAATCTPLWTGQVRRGFAREETPTVADGEVFIGNNRSLTAFAANGCGSAVCQPLWHGPAHLISGAPAVANGIVYVNAEPNPQTKPWVGSIEAFAAAGCGQARCKPLWTGINSTAGGESSPVVANGVVYVGKDPARPNSDDDGVISYPAAGCGRHLCRPLGITSTGGVQLYFEGSTAVVNGRIYLPSIDSSRGVDDAGVYVFQLPAHAA
jgi:outer membrane protein assembly factor BamB